MTSLVQAVIVGDVQKISALISEGAIVDVVEDNSTPLCIAAENGNIYVARELLDHGASIDSIECGNNALNLACMEGKIDMVEFLISRGASVNIKGSIGGNTALHYAAETGSVDILRCLLEAGAIITERNDNMDTAVMLTVYYGNLEALKYLHQQGASLLDVTEDGETLLLSAISNEQKEIADWLLKQEGISFKDRNTMTGDTALHIAAGNGDTDMMKYALDNGCNIDEENNDGESPIIKAVMEDEAEAVLWFLSHGATIKDSDAILSQIEDNENPELLEQIGSFLSGKQ